MKWLLNLIDRWVYKVIHIEGVNEWTNFEIDSNIERKMAFVVQEQKNETIAGLELCCFGQA